MRELFKHLVVSPIERAEANVIQTQPAGVDAFSRLDALHANEVRNANCAGTRRTAAAAGEEDYSESRETASAGELSDTAHSSHIGTVSAIR